jgi:hypothetical protein
MLSAAAVVAPPASFNASGATSGSLSLNITQPYDGQYFGASTVVVKWEAESVGHTIQHYIVKMNDQEQYTNQNSTTFSDLSDGRYTITVTAVNDIEETAQDSVVFFVDTSAPVLNILSPGNHTALNRSNVTITWQASDPDLITYYKVKIDGEPWSYPIIPTVTSHTFNGTADGNHDLTVMAFDGSGKSTSKTITILVDTIPPVLHLTYPANNTGFDHSDVTVVWSGSDTGGLGGSMQGYEVWVDGSKMITAAATENHDNRTYSDGYHTVRIVAVDIANSTATDEVTFLVDTVAPAIVSALPEGDLEPVNTAIVVNFTKPMDHLATTITIEGVTGTVSWDRTFLTFTPSSPLAYGTTYTVTVSGRDLVGSPISKSWTFTTTDMGTISGIIVDNNGNPLGGASVRLDDGTTVVTNERGEFTFEARAGPHNLTVSKSGWDGLTMMVTVQPGVTTGLGSFKVTPSNPLAMYGIIAAVAGVSIVAVLIYLNHRKKEKGPPARSWKGMEQMQKRANKGRKKNDEDDEDLDDLV